MTTTPLAVVRGAPEPEELAALLASLAMMSAPTAEAEAGSAWNDRARDLHAPGGPGPDRWRWSTR